MFSRVFSTSANKMKIGLFFLVTVISLNCVESELTESQFDAAFQFIREVCKKENGVTDEVVDAMHRGEFNDERASKCYAECSLRHLHVFKDGKSTYEDGLAQLPNTPASRKDDVIWSIETVNNFEVPSTITDKCEAAYELYKHIQALRPENFFAP